MKLNMDCVRAVMLCVEEHTDFDHRCSFIHYARADSLVCLGEDPVDPPEYQVKLESNFDNEDMIYSVKYCVEAGLIVLSPSSTLIQYQISIKDLTPAGHDFLANIREDRVWKKVKQTAAKVGAVSLNVLVEIAKDVALSLAKQAAASIL